MNWFVPREHGAWAMLVVPFLLGMLVSSPNWLHFPFFIGVLAIYFSSGPLLAYIRKPSFKKSILPAFIIYFSIGIVFLFPILLLIPELFFLSLFIVPFFAMNIYFAKMKKERLFINDLCAIIGLSILVLIAYYLGNHTIDNKAVVLMLINIIFFTASVYHVKTLIRENGNRVFLIQSYAFHGLTAIAIVMTMPLLSFVFFLSALKTWLMPKNKRFKPIQIGLIEIVNSVVFVIAVGLFF